MQGSPDDARLDDLLARLPAGAAVLELGCGQGEAARRIVDSGHRYVGVDISAEQLGRARTLVSEGEFRRADIAELVFGAESFGSERTRPRCSGLPLNREQRGPLTSRELCDGADQREDDEPRKRQSQEHPSPHSALDARAPGLLP